MTEILMRQAVRDAVDEVLDKMFFAQTLGECSIADSSDPREEEIAVQVAFQGQPSGSLLLRLTAAAARQIAADFLGVDEREVSGLQTSEVIRELANMICGSVLSRVESAATFRLGAPQIVEASEASPNDPAGTRYCVQLLNGRLAVTLGPGTPLCQQIAPFAY